ncbi:MAG: hypothetical protein J5494_06300, partial [Candidatus Methanomethylophilaceae archaeon]|nr:hypothetical protein [Candidatus Methanomethylophilaceae archaeon]
FGYYLRKKFTAMDDSDINRAGRYSRRGDVRPALDEIDLDRSSDVVRAILRKPSAWPGALNLYLRSLF